MDTQLNYDNVKKIPKSFDSNKLINPDIIIEDEEEENIEDENDEMDDETLEIINRVRLKKINLEESTIFLDNKPKNIKESKVKKTLTKANKKISFKEFTKSIEVDNKQNITKFTSKRVEDKKNQSLELSNTLIPKRQFNPRKPTYNFTRKINTPNINDYNNIQEFPQLK